VVKETEQGTQRGMGSERTMSWDSNLGHPKRSVAHKTAFRYSKQRNTWIHKQGHRFVRGHCEVKIFQKYHQKFGTSLKLYYIEWL